LLSLLIYKHIAPKGTAINAEEEEEGEASNG
jgi:hypothetical protein